MEHGDWDDVIYERDALFLMLSSMSASNGTGLILQKGKGNLPQGWILRGPSVGGGGDVSACDDAYSFACLVPYF
jgi:hypothetical protein